MIITNARKAYEAYREERRRQDPEAAAAMPEYKDLGPVLKPAWNAVARALTPKDMAPGEQVPVVVLDIPSLGALCDRYGIRNDVGFPMESFLDGVRDFMLGTPISKPPYTGAWHRDAWTLGWRLSEQRLPPEVDRIRFVSLLDALDQLKEQAA